MGTNYYAHANKCDCCDRYDEIHVGKSSYGWYFSLHVTDDITSLEDWKKILQDPNTKIVDEYDDDVSYDHLISIMTDRKTKKSKHSITELIQNQACIGLNNLLKHDTNVNCIGYAKDLPISYIVDEFS